MTRRVSRIRSIAAAVLAGAAVAAPAAVADTPVADHPGVTVPAAAGQIVGDPVGDRVRPAAQTQLVGDPIGDRLRPGAQVSVVEPASAPLARADGFDWFDAGIGAGGLALLLLVGTGAAKGVKTRRGLVRAV